jgi:hypothetical protein
MIEAPVLAGIRASISLNNTSRQTTMLQLANDTTTRRQIPLNAQSSTTRYRFARSGWQSLADSLEVFVEDSMAHPHERMGEWVLTHGRYGLNNVRVSALSQGRLPDWAWFGLLVFCLTALWLEPKV